MSSRETLLGEKPGACPFVALEADRDRRLEQPDHRHRCYAEPTPAPRSIAHQQTYCLSPNFAACPIFQEWAARAAAEPVPAKPGHETHALPTVVASAAMAGAGSDEQVEPTGPAVGEAPDEDIGGTPLEAAPSLGLAGEDVVYSGEGLAPVYPEAFDDAPAPKRSYGGWPDPEPDPEPEPEPIAAAVAPLPAFLAGREEAHPEFIPPPPGPDEIARVKRADVVPSWDIDDRHGAHPQGDSGDDVVTRIITALAVLAILSIAIAAVLLVPGLLAGPGTTPIPTPTPTAPALAATHIATATPPAATVVVVPTAASVAVPPSSPTPTVPAATATPTPRGSIQTYRVQPGDGLKRIARRFGLSVQELLAANPQIEDPNHIEVGQVLVIPNPEP